MTDVGQRLDGKNLLGAAPQLALVLTSVYPLGTACNQNLVNCTSISLLTVNMLTCSCDAPYIFVNFLDLPENVVPP